MEIKDYVLLVLVGFIIFTYVKPLESHTFSESLVNKTKSMVGDVDLPIFESRCPTAADYVCANGVTYLNACMAKKAGYEAYTPGECGA